MNEKPPSPLVLGNQAFDNNDYTTAIEQYLIALDQIPELSDIIDINIRLARARVTLHSDFDPSIYILDCAKKINDGQYHLLPLKDRMNLSETVKLDKFLVMANWSILAPLSMVMNDLMFKLLHRMKNTNQATKKRETQNWRIIFTKLKRIRSLLQTTNDNEFINILYDKSLGRKPQIHEQKHFSECLNNKKLSRYEITCLVCTSEECKRHFENDILQAENYEYWLPNPGDISPQDIYLPFFVNPEVSVIIPVYGKMEYTLGCLKSIEQNIPNVSFEVLILDDCSPDDSVKQLRLVKNAKIIINPQNLGFLKSCNHGAKLATGKYIYFLNNDTLVKPGWLDELYKTFELFPETGLVGSKLIYPDGNLQEAGGIIWKDGSAWNFGNKQQPNLPVYNYAREVDYVSGASLMIPAALFADIGGFDEIYAPAYCEDSDLALKVRNAGYRVIYQPMSEIIHFEGVSSGTDLTQGIKAYQVQNSKTLFERWQHKLSLHRPNGVYVDGEKDRRMQKRVLVIENCTPTPDQDAGSVSVFNILLLLREMDFQITFIPEDNFLYMPDYTRLLQRNGIEMLYAPYVTSVLQHVEQYGYRYDINTSDSFPPIEENTSKEGLPIR